MNLLISQAAEDYSNEENAKFLHFLQLLCQGLKELQSREPDASLYDAISGASGLLKNKNAEERSDDDSVAIRQQLSARHKVTYLFLRFAKILLREEIHHGNKCICAGTPKALLSVMTLDQPRLNKDTFVES